jgi:DNA-directed RNA polymerase subunit H (RpoH/RPB5)
MAAYIREAEHAPSLAQQCATGKATLDVMRRVRCSAAVSVPDAREFRARQYGGVVMSLSKQQHQLPSIVVAPDPARKPGPTVPGDVEKLLRESRRRRREQRVDDELAQSFPASDPPSWVLGTTPTSR